MAENTQKPLKQLKEASGRSKKEFYPYTVPEAVLGSDGTTLKDTLESFPSSYVQQSEKGKANGIATLGGDGRIPEEQMPPGYLKEDDAEQTYAKKEDIPSSPDLSGYLTEQDASEKYLEKSVAESEYLKKRDEEKNTIISVKRNGTVISPDESKAVDISVPTKTSELENDSNYMQGDRLIVTGTDPEDGGTVPYSDGTIIFVYGE